MNQLKQRLKKARVNELSKISRINSELKGHLIPRTANAINMHCSELMREQLYLLLAGLEDLCEINQNRLEE